MVISENVLRRAYQHIRRLKYRLLGAICKGPNNCVLLSQKFESNVYKPIQIDVNAADFSPSLNALNVDLVIHTSGPFQGQSHAVPLACIEAGCHYIDLADDRAFVCGIDALNSAAKSAGVILVSGASSVPGLSSTVVDRYLTEFTRLDTIDVAIAPGNKAERGEATVRGILTYTGHAFKRWQDGRWVDVYGWMSTRVLDFGKRIGKRRLANVDVPDLALFPERYTDVKSVRFQAGLELPMLHVMMVMMAVLRRIRLVPNWALWTTLTMKISRLFDRFGSDDGAMRVSLSGLGSNGKPKTLHWTLYAYDGIGPYIPTLSTIILANKLIEASRPSLTIGDESPSVLEAGAQACLGLYTLEAFDIHATALHLEYEVERLHG